MATLALLSTKCPLHIPSLYRSLCAGVWLVGIDKLLAVEVVGETPILPFLLVFLRVGPSFLNRASVTFDSLLINMGDWISHFRHLT